MAAANGRLEDLVIKMWPTPMGAHIQLYIAKIRSTGLFGAEVWGVENCSILCKEEPALLRTLCKSFRRPKTDMVLYYLKMGRLDQIAIRRTFGFWANTLRTGDIYESTALEFWKDKCRTERKGWLHKLMQKLKRMKCWTEWFEGGTEEAINWKGEKAEARKKELKEEMETQEEDRQRKNVLKSKHAWTMELFPTYESKRPYEIESLARMQTHILTRWFLCEHNLEIETGRWSRTPKEKRYCRACKSELGEELIGDEVNVLTKCCRSKRGRNICKKKLHEIITKANEE